MTSEERRRALDSLVQIAGRMRYLGVLVLRDKPDLPKLSGELEGMAAWVCAFARVIGGEPSGVLEGEPIPLDLVSVQATDVSQERWVAKAHWPGEGIEGETPPVPSLHVAQALALIVLALRRVNGPELPTAGTELSQRLSQALCMFHEVDLVPELNAHGMPEDG